jgi:hypothetical protein
VWLLALALVPLTAGALCGAEAYARLARHRAESAADLAALAAAGRGGCAAAELTANASGAVVQRCARRADGSVVVSVRVAAGPFGAAQATARAGPTTLSGAPSDPGT